MALKASQEWECTAPAPGHGESGNPTHSGAPVPLGRGAARSACGAWDRQPVEQACRACALAAYLAGAPPNSSTPLLLQLEILPQRATGTFKQNAGLELVLDDLVKSLAPRLIEDWTPVLEKYVNVRLDEKLQDLQISDIINQLDN